MNIKTTTQRNRDQLIKQKNKAFAEQVLKRKFDKDIERLDNLIKQDENSSNRLRKKIARKLRLEAEENARQETIGTITKPKNIGRFKYKQRKLDYQLEDELSGSLRQMRPLGNDMLLEDRFDSIFRRNLVEPDAPTQNEKRRQRKAKYKMVSKLGSVAADLHAETQVLRQKNDAKQKGFKQVIDQDDVIII